MSLFKMKRGQESKVSSLAKEDGSLIFSLNGANDSTVRLDQTVNGTVQRLGIAVDKAKSADSASTASTANVAKLISPFENATANASRNVWFSDSGTRNKPVYNDNFKYNPVTQVLTTNISGSAASATTARYLFQASEGGTAGKNGWVKAISIQIKANYCNSPLMFAVTQCGRPGPTFLYVYFSNANSVDPPLGAFSYSGNSITAKIIKSTTSVWDIWIYKAESYDSIGVMIAQYDFPYIGPKVAITYPDAFSESDPGTGTSPSPFGNVAHSANSDALGGSSLSQVLASAGGGNAFTGLDTTTNNVVKLTRANGGTVQKTINNVSNASTASYALDAAKLGGSPASSYYKIGSSINADTLDGYHETSFLRYRGNTTTSGQNTLWKQIGIQEYDGCYPDGLTNGVYNYGEVISLPSNGCRFDLWVNHNSSNGATNGLQYRSGWNDDKKSWRMILDSGNYTNYAADRTAFSGVSISGRNITFTRANGTTVGITTQDNNSTYPVYGKTLSSTFANGFRSETFGSTANGWYISAVRNNTAGVANAPQYGSGIAWGQSDTHGYLYVSYSSAAAYIGGGDANKLNWQKQLAFLDSTVANATSAANSERLGGKPSSDYALKTDLSGTINAASAKRLESYPSQSISNSFFYRYGTVGYSSDGGKWDGFPSAILYAATSTANGFGNALYQKKVGVLHLASGSSAHDLVFQAGGTNGGIAYVATGRNPAYILDTLNYKDKAYVFNKLTASSTFTATSGVVIDGGSY